MLKSKFFGILISGRDRICNCTYLCIFKALCTSPSFIFMKRSYRQFKHAQNIKGFSYIIFMYIRLCVYLTHVSLYHHVTHRSAWRIEIDPAFCKNVPSPPVLSWRCPQNRWRVTIIFPLDFLLLTSFTTNISILLTIWRIEKSNSNSSSGSPKLVECLADLRVWFNDFKDIN